MKRNATWLAIWILVFFATYAIAQVGLKDVKVTTPSGSFTLSNGFRILAPPPVITSFVPSDFKVGTTMDVIMNGQNLIGATVVFDPASKITATVLPGGTATTVPLRLVIAADAPIG